MIKVRSVLVLLYSILLIGCGAKADAEAYAIRSKARRQNEIHQLEMKKENALFPETTQARRNFLVLGQVGFAVLIGGTIIIGLYLGHGLARAEVKRRRFMATLIPLDPVTRQYPLLPYEGPAGVLRIHNPNTGQVLRLDQGSEANLNMVDNAAKVQAAGLLVQPDQNQKLLNGGG